MKQIRSLYPQFKPDHYLLSLRPSGEAFEAHLEITGQKLGRPSKRIVFHQKGLKIIKAGITRQDKRGPTDYEVSRINHLPSFEEVRLHTAEMLFPGDYKIIIDYRLGPYRKGSPRRELLPCIDEPEAWAQADLVKQSRP